MVKEALHLNYNKFYKLLLIVPALMIIFSLGYLFMFYQQHGDIIKRDVSLTGGTTITVFDQNANINDIKSELAKSFSDIAVRGLSDIATGNQRGFTLETTATVEQIKPALEKELGYSLTGDNSSIEFSGAALSQGFYVQLLYSIVAAFLLMAWVVFIIFSSSKKIKALSTMLTFFGVAVALMEVGWLRALSIFAIIVSLGIIVLDKQTKAKEKGIYALVTLALILILYLFEVKMLLVVVGAVLVIIYITGSIPSFAVILSAFADILMTLAVVDLRGMSISGAGIVAFLMLIGYSVDTDILLTSRLLKNKIGSINSRIYGAFKTGMTMTLTAIVSVGISLIVIYNLSETLRQIFEIILIGLFFDIFNTWLTNASMLKWYMEAKKLE